MTVFDAAVEIYRDRSTECSTEEERTVAAKESARIAVAIRSSVLEAQEEELEHGTTIVTEGLKLLALGLDDSTDEPSTDDFDEYGVPLHD